MDFDRKSIWKITASVSVALMLLTIGMFTASACQAEKSPAYSDLNSLSFGGCDKSNCIGDCCDDCTEANCEGDCCEKCIDVCGLDNCTGDCCDDCTEADCEGDCCENCVDECGQACDQRSCADNSGKTCDQIDCAISSKQSTCSK